MERGIRGGKCECGTTEICFTGNSVKSSCLIRFFCGKATEASVTVFRVAPTERGRFGGKSMFSLCSINSDGGVCSQVPATATSKSFQVRRIPAISDCTGERERDFRAVLEKENLKCVRVKVKIGGIYRLV